MGEIYLISSSDKYVIKKNLNKILVKEKDSEVIYFDLEEVPISNVIEELDTFNFLSLKKTVVAENAFFLTAEKPKVLVEHNLERLEKYIENPNPENTLILTCSKVDSKRKLVKLLKEKANVVMEDSVNILKELISSKEDYQVSDSTLNFLISYLNQDNYRIMNEFEKLKLFKYDEKKIDIKDIEEFVTKNIDDNIFSLIDHIVNKDKKKAFEVYEDLILKNEEPMKIMILLANKFRLFYQVKVLSKTISSSDEIASIIGSHPYPVKLARNMVYKYSEKDLLDILYKLANLDYDIKSGSTYNNIGFEMLILSL